MAIESMGRACPGFDDNSIDWLPFVDSRWNAFFKEGLRRVLLNRGTRDA
jgi:hypothetical protein